MRKLRKILKKTRYNSCVLFALHGLIATYLFLMINEAEGRSEYIPLESKSITRQVALESSSENQGTYWKHLQKRVFISCVKCHNEAQAGPDPSLTDIHISGDRSSAGQLHVKPGDAKDRHIFTKMTDDIRVEDDSMPFDEGTVNEGIIIGKYQENSLGQLNWDQMQELIFQPYCVECHKQSLKKKMGNLSLEQDQSTNIVSPQLSSSGVSLAKLWDGVVNSYRRSTKQRPFSLTNREHKGSTEIFGVLMPGLGVKVDSLKTLVTKTHDSKPISEDSLTWNYIQENIFKPYCVPCHDERPPTEGASLTAR